MGDRGGSGRIWGAVRRRAALPLLLLLLLAPGGPQPAAAKKRKVQPRSGVTTETLEERGLLPDDPASLSAADLAEGAREWHADAGARRFSGPVLAYVTPWHRSGYEAAVRYRGKLTHVSPVWYQLRTGDDGGLTLVGGHEYNATWIEKLRAPLEGGAAAEDGDGDAAAAAAAAEGSNCPLRRHCGSPLVVPRVIVELGGRELALLLTRPGPAVERIVEEVDRRGYDGIVFEAWQQWAAMGALRDGGFLEAAVSLVESLAASLKAKGGRVLVLAVPPALPAGPGRPHSDVGAMRRLAAAVAGFSVMTYDHLASAPGFNAPLPWAERNLEMLLEGGDSQGEEEGQAIAPRQVFLGVNFYGYEFSRPDGSGPGVQWASEPVLADRFLTVLGRLQPAMGWDADAQEHRIKFKEGGKRRVLAFPTPPSLAARVSLASRWGAGLSIWELGQGYDALFDLL